MSKSVDDITDRAKRYRANVIHKKRKRCEECGSRKNLGVGHRDGDESNNRPSNLFTQCKSCNGKQAVRDKKAGRGVRTRQYNPGIIPWGVKDKTGYLLSLAKETSVEHTMARLARAGGDPKKAAKMAAEEARERVRRFSNPSAINLAQYVQAAVDHVRGSHDAGGKMLHETPKAIRRQFAKEIWFRRGYRGNPPADIMPEFWAGKLKDSHGRKVTDPEQARAILLSELRALGRIPVRKNARRNPSEADALYRKFHGRGPDKIYEMQVAGIDPYGGHPELTSLGPLIRFIVGEGVVLGGQFGDEVREAEWVREISFVPSVARWHEWLERTDPPVAEAKAKLREWKTPDLAAVTNTKQLYILGGAYTVDPREMGADPDKDLWDLGNVYLIEYFTQKRFDRFEPINYFHHFGEKSGVTPRLIFDRVHKLLSLAGGEYEVKAAGITN